MFNGSDFQKEKEILLPFSLTEERASFIEDQDSETESIFFPRQKNKTNFKSVKKALNIKNGQISFHIVGYPGIQNISASDLVHYIPFSRLKAAAKKFLKHSGIKKKRKRRINKNKILKSNEARHQGHLCTRTSQENDTVNDNGAAI